MISTYDIRGRMEGEKQSKGQQKKGRRSKKKIKLWRMESEGEGRRGVERCFWEEVGVRLCGWCNLSVSQG